jgi:hypothetical protein
VTVYGNTYSPSQRHLAISLLLWSSFLDPYLLLFSICYPSDTIIGYSATIYHYSNMNPGECKASGLNNNYQSFGTSSSSWLTSQFFCIGLMGIVIMILSHYILQKRVQPTTSCSRKQQRRRRRRRDLYSFQRRRDRLSFSEEHHDCSDRDQPLPSSQHNAEVKIVYYCFIVLL